MAAQDVPTRPVPESAAAPFRSFDPLDPPDPSDRAAPWIAPVVADPEVARPGVACPGVACPGVACPEVWHEAWLTQGEPPNAAEPEPQVVSPCALPPSSTPATTMMKMTGISAIAY